MDESRTNSARSASGSSSTAWSRTNSGVVRSVTATLPDELSRVGSQPWGVRPLCGVEFISDNDWEAICTFIEGGVWISDEPATPADKSDPLTSTAERVFFSVSRRMPAANAEDLCRSEGT